MDLDHFLAFYLELVIQNNRITTVTDFKDQDLSLQQ